jgi:hypothetical protein
MQWKERLLDIHVDANSLQRAISARFDLSKLMVNLPHPSAELTVKDLLRHIVAQIPGNATFLAADTGVEITTVARANTLRPYWPRVRTTYSGGILLRQRGTTKAV